MSLNSITVVDIKLFNKKKKKNHELVYQFNC